MKEKGIGSIGVLLALISHASAQSCRDYVGAGQNFSVKNFFNVCGWYFSIPALVIGLILTIWPDIFFRINLWTVKHAWGSRWKPKWGGPEAIIRTQNPRIEGRVGGIAFLIIGIIVLAIQIIY